jgi:hypothetical protein
MVVTNTLIAHKSQISVPSSFAQPRSDRPRTMRQRHVEETGVSERVSVVVVVVEAQIQPRTMLDQICPEPVRRLPGDVRPDLGAHHRQHLPGRAGRTEHAANKDQVPEPATAPDPARRCRRDGDGVQEPGRQPQRDQLQPDPRGDLGEAARPTRRPRDVGAHLRRGRAGRRLISA